MCNEVHSSVNQAKSDLGEFSITQRLPPPIITPADRENFNTATNTGVDESSA